MLSSMRSQLSDLQNTLTASWGEGCSSGDGGVVPTVAPLEDGTHVAANERSFPRKGGGREGAGSRSTCAWRSNQEWG